MKVLWKLATCVALAGVAGCASNPPKETKFPPKCDGAYTPVNALTHYSESALHDYPDLLARRAEALQDKPAVEAEKQP